MRLILASTSPRRREILAMLGLPFEIIAPDFDETLTQGLAIEDEVLTFAVGKAQSVVQHHGDCLVIGSDTMIACADEKIGKPRDYDDARRILSRLSGRSHEILTSVAILDGTGGPGLRCVEVVHVEMHDYGVAEIEAYLACGESMDKAGAYSIQGEGSKLIRAIDGDFLAAVGLPLRPIADYLRGRGLVLKFDVERLYAERAYLNWPNFP